MCLYFFNLVIYKISFLLLEVVLERGFKNLLNNCAKKNFYQSIEPEEPGVSATVTAVYCD